mgnify:FL=1
MSENFRIKIYYADRKLRGFEVRVGDVGGELVGAGYDFTQNSVCRRVSNEYFDVRDLDIQCVLPLYGSVISLHLVGEYRGLNICSFSFY